MVGLLKIYVFAAIIYDEQFLLKSAPPHTCDNAHEYLLNRGKCSIALLNETESVLSYLAKEDTFFYSLVYDPSLKTLLADKGEIRVGPKYQADVPDMLTEGKYFMVMS
ncbi:UNVERIFIED_CONTAM: hypothetical protein K2H54_046531 [Gekko kuhli]